MAQKSSKEAAVTLAGTLQPVNIEAAKFTRTPSKNFSLRQYQYMTSTSLYY
jgi:hypothetical protein